MSWFQRIFRRRDLYDDVAAEMHEHLQEKTEQLIRLEGLSREEAEQRARRAFGNPTLMQEKSKEVWQWRALESLWADTKFALRQMRKSPGFSVTVVVLLGLGIGATTAVFSLVDTILLKPVPYPDPATLVVPWNIPPAGVNIGGFEKFPWSPIHFHALEQETNSFRYLGAFQGSNFNLTGAGDPTMLEGALVSWGFFPALGMMLILTAVAAVLLIVCFNVAGLLLTRSIARHREFTVRAALGAGRGRVLRQLLTESLLLAVAGGILGMAIAVAGVWLVKSFGPQDLPRLDEAGADFRVFAFASMITLFTGILFGLAPALGATRVDLVESLKDGGQKSGSGRSHPRLRSALVVSQIALAMVLVITSGLLVRTFAQLLASDSGFRSEHVLTFELSLPNTRYPDRDHIARFYQQALPRLHAIAGVEMAGITEAVPMGGATESTAIRIVGRPVAKGQRFPIVNYTIVSPGLFSALGTPLLRGRDLLNSDLLSAPAVTVINRAMARQYWPNEDPVGKQLIVPSQRVPATIVGVVADMKHTSLREVPGPEMFEPYTQNVWPAMALMQVVLRTNADPSAVIGSARQAIHELDPSVPLAKIQTLSTLTNTVMAGDRFSMLLVVFFGLLALLLAAVGIYGVISYSVSQRTREIGIRMALGARRVKVFKMILRQGLMLAGLGIALGVVAALGAGRMLAGFLYGVRATDPLTFVSVAIFLGAVALAASFFPARRAAKTDPMRALHYE